MNNDFPRINEEEPKEEKIEIPQEYYDKLEQEKQERIKALEEKEKEHEETKGSGNTFLFIIVNALIILGILYIMINNTHYAIFAFPIYYIIGTIISCNKSKKETKFNITLLVGGMISALVCFVVGMSNKDLEDTFIYYAFASAIAGFIGYLLSTIITKFLTEKENIKALQTILYLLILVAIFGAPYYCYTKYKEDFIKLVFQQKDIVIASSQEEFIASTLENRYDEEISCPSKAKNYYIDSINKRKVTERICTTNNIEFIVTSTAYNETNIEYVVKDNLLDVLYIDNIKSELKSLYSSQFNTNKVSISLFPKSKCYFVGDCENNENYTKETNLDTIYNYSKGLSLNKYLNMSKEEFFNEYGFKIQIIVKGGFLSSAENALEEYANSILNTLKSKGYKNVGGYEIILEDRETITNVYHIDGAATSSGEFTGHKIVND